MTNLFFKRIKRKALLSGFCTMRELGRTPPPKTVIWECTLACNMECIHCGSGDSRTTRDELSTGEISDIIRDLSQTGVMRFLATGGEPLLRADLLEVLERAKECGLETGFSTNGSRISEENIARIVRAADSIQVSVDGIGGTHDTLRMTDGAFAVAMNALNLLKTHGCRQACMTSIISPRNIHELEDLYTLARKHADLWRIGTVMPIGRASEDDSLFLSDGQLRSLLDFIAGKMHDRFPILLGENLGYLGDCYDRKIHRNDFFFCGIGIISCCIGADGQVRGCPELPPAGGYIAGDLRRESFADIWEKGFGQFRDGRCSSIPAECRECRDLDLCGGGCQVMSLKGMHCTKKRVESPGT
ncbi:radical SAM protein [Methanoregula sp.]|uniref:radical SAM protein n=1 Tax=Methanoregula sp. TaxID=2052170 RepID=UPI003C71ABAF